MQGKKIIILIKLMLIFLLQSGRYEYVVREIDFVLRISIPLCGKLLGQSFKSFNPVNPDSDNSPRKSV